MKKSAVASEVIGLIPAVGYSRSISPIPCSKEIYPVGFYIHVTGDVGLPQHLVRAVKYHS